MATDTPTLGYCTVEKPLFRGMLVEPAVSNAQQRPSQPRVRHILLHSTPVFVTAVQDARWFLFFP